MTEDTNKEALSRQYLLRKLSEEDATRLEEEYFADDDFFEEMELAEDEIIDAYVRNELSPEERKLFEENLLTSRRMSKRVDFAKNLAARASLQHREKNDLPLVSDKGRRVHPAATDATANSRSWKAVFWPASAWQRAAFATLVLAFVVGGAALFVDWLRVREQSRQLATSRAELERKNRDLIAENDTRTSETQRLAEALKLQEAENAKLNEEIERTSTTPVQRPIIPILLSVSGGRSTGTEKPVKLPAQPAIFELRVVLEEAKYERYLITVTTVDERIISGPHQLKAQGKTLRLRLSSTRFTSDDYIVTVSGVTPTGPEEVEDFTLRIAGNKIR